MNNMMQSYTDAMRQYELEADKWKKNPVYKAYKNEVAALTKLFHREPNLILEPPEGIKKSKFVSLQEKFIRKYSGVEWVHVKCDKDGILESQCKNVDGVVFDIFPLFDEEANFYALQCGEQFEGNIMVVGEGESRLCIYSPFDTSKEVVAKTHESYIAMKKSEHYQSYSAAKEQLKVASKEFFRQFGTLVSIPTAPNAYVKVKKWNK